MQASRNVVASAILLAVLSLTMAATPQAARKSAGPAAAPAPACGGTDMMPELAASDPQLVSVIEGQSAATQNGANLLWKIEKDGLPASYLFGTIHLSDPRVTELPKPAREALGRATTVALEVADLSPQSAAIAMSAAMRLAVFTDGGDLESLISQEEYAKVKKTVSAAGIPGDTARLLRPWIVTMLMSSTDCERKRVQAGALVQDMRIAEAARKRNLPLVSLESVDGQLESLARIPHEQQLQMLRVSLAYADRTRDLVETTVQFYLKRRIGMIWPFQIALATKTGASEETFKAFQQQLIADRNAQMRDKALPSLEKGGAFIAVGALHLPGPAGLVALLRERGYTLTPAD